MSASDLDFADDFVVDMTAVSLRHTQYTVTITGDARFPFAVVDAAGQEWNAYTDRPVAEHIAYRLNHPEHVPGSVAEYSELDELLDTTPQRYW